MLQKILDSLGYSGKYPVGAPVKCHRAFALYLCEVPSGANPAELGTRIMQELGIEQSNCRSWKPAKANRALVLREGNGQLSLVVPSSAKMRKKGMSIAEIRRVFRTRKKPILGMGGVWGSWR